MPTVFVKTKLDYKIVRRIWDKASAETRDEWAADAMHPYAQMFRMTLNEYDERERNASLMGLKEGYFSPYNAFKITFDQQTGTIHTQFDGVIKLPISNDADAALKAWPKSKPTVIWLSGPAFFDDRTIDFAPISFPCTISRSKPKDASF
ncbi:MAG: hypothetical protein P4L83_24785 [Nevskia sp.]|nr:hypothetical protein [Nevskia sp.]